MAFGRNESIKSLICGASLFLFTSCRTSGTEEATSFEASMGEIGPSDVNIGNITTTGLSNSMKAFLDVIAAAEGTSRKSSPCSVGNGYRAIVGCYANGSRLTSGYNAHPRGDLKYGSDAAGRYQFISTTWAGLGQPNFKPASQDRATVILIKQTGSYQAVESIPERGKPEFVNALDLLKRQWASLPAKPGSRQPYKQPVKSANSLWTIYQAAYKIYSAGSAPSGAKDNAEESDRLHQRPVDLSKPQYSSPRSPECLDVLARSHGEDVAIWTPENGTTTIKGEDIPKANIELLQEFIEKCND